MKYASKTEVSGENSQLEIKRILTRYGASKFLFYEEETSAVVMFEMHDRRVKFSLPFPKMDDFKFTEVRRTMRSPAEQKKAFEQGCRQRWRALVLAIKAKLEAVESNIATFEQEFLSYIVLPNQQTVSEFVLPQLEAAYNSGAMPKMLPGIGETVH